MPTTQRPRPQPGIERWPSCGAALHAEREHYLPVPGARLFVREVGEGTPLVVLHGGPDFDHHYLLPAMDRLAAVSHLVYYDQRGRGRSSLGVEPEDVGIESEVDDLDQIRRHLGRSTIALLGHSWGSVLAMEYATRHPEHVSHLILVNIAPASHRGLISFREWRATREGDNLKLLRAIAETPAFEAGDIAAETEYYRVHFGKSLYPPGDLDTLVGSLRTHFTPADVLKARAIEGRLHEQTWRRPEYDLIPRLRELKMPVLVIHGDSELIPLECARNVAEAVPGAKLVVLNGCGHFAYLERPAEVLEAVAALLAG